MNVFKFAEVIACLAMLPFVLAPFAPFISKALDEWEARKDRKRREADDERWRKVREECRSHFPHGPRR